MSTRRGQCGSTVALSAGAFGWVDSVIEVAGNPSLSSFFLSFFPLYTLPLQRLFFVPHTPLHVVIPTCVSSSPPSVTQTAAQQTWPSSQRPTSTKSSLPYRSPPLNLPLSTDSMPTSGTTMISSKQGSGPSPRLKAALPHSQSC